VRLLVGCALGNVLRIRAPEVPYEADETLKARRRRARGAPACPRQPGPDSSLLLLCRLAALPRCAGRVPPVSQLHPHAGRAAQQRRLRPRRQPAEHADQGARVAAFGVTTA
jgi:hypothetical protein